LAQLDEYACCELLIARIDPIADASFPDIRARSKPGTAIEAMMPMMATTISSSISVNPLLLLMSTAQARATDVPRLNTRARDDRQPA
jgi:hypothetical protein